MKERPAVFGQQGWYPDNPKRCREALQTFAGASPDTGSALHGGIVPHAGWFFSGALATKTFAALAKGVPAPDLVWIFGGHMLPGDSPVCMTEGAWATPFGPVPVQADLAARFQAEFPCVIETPKRFQPDNTIELQMPILKHFWPDTRVLALQVPPDEMAETIGAWAATQSEGLHALAIGSTDLTHYGANYGFSPRGTGKDALRWAQEENDRPFVERLLVMDGPGAIEHARRNQSACCPGAAAAALAFAKQQGAKAGRLLAQNTSHDKDPSHKPESWVGYASIVY